MRQGIGASQVFMIIMIYLVIIAGVLGATVLYYKAFKINSMVLAILEKYEGYNGLASEEINTKMAQIGYLQKNSSNDCPERNGKNAEKNADSDYYYCVYYYGNDTGDGEKKNSYYSYAVVTYIALDLPVVNTINIPVYTRGERIYKFSGSVNS